ncbi:alpha-1,2-fucosyltransferase [Verrucomicrobiota bacterium]
MIIVRLIGGLGNQMFQYAAARRLAYKLGVDLKLDISGFKDYKDREYWLGNFNIHEKFASQAEIKELLDKKRGRAGRLISCLLQKPVMSSAWISERHFHFNPSILSLTDGVYLNGHWVSEKYFVDIEKIIRQEFTVKTPQTSKNREISEKIVSTDSVSIHIRRGDYLTNPKFAKFFVTCGPDYYLQCVEQTAESVKDPHFFVFGDDPEWARNNLKLSYDTIVCDHNGPDKAHEDLRLISQCKHHIIANSTFSWWGTWLNPRKDKKVFAPKQWFSEKIQASRNMDDLLPEGWQKR